MRRVGHLGSHVATRATAVCESSRAYLVEDVQVLGERVAAVIGHALGAIVWQDVERRRHGDGFSKGRRVSSSLAQHLSARLGRFEGKKVSKVKRAAREGAKTKRLALGFDRTKKHEDPVVAGDRQAKYSLFLSR